MSLTLKLVSLGIRTLAKPVGNYIKKQAKEHERFRQVAVWAAQGVHKVDMRMRLGILHDSATQERMRERALKIDQEKKRQAEIPIVRNEAEQKEHDKEKAKEDGNPKPDPNDKQVKIAPLSEAKAIELGANFFSEFFIFAVAAGLLVYEQVRRGRSESQKRDVLTERVEQLESEVEALRARLDPDLETLHDLGERMRAAKTAKQYSWWNPVGWMPGRSVEDTAIMEESKDLGKLQEEEHIVPIRTPPPAAGKEGEVKVDTAKVHEGVQEQIRKLDERLPAPKPAPNAALVEREESVPASNRGR